MSPARHLQPFCCRPKTTTQTACTIRLRTTLPCKRQASRQKCICMRRATMHLDCGPRTFPLQDGPGWWKSGCGPLEWFPNKSSLFRTENMRKAGQPLFDISAVGNPSCSINRFSMKFAACCCALLVLFCALPLFAESGEAAWLRYAPIEDQRQYASLPDTVIFLNKSALAKSAATELQRGLSGMLGKHLRIADNSQQDAFVLATVTEAQKRFPEITPGKISGDGFWLKSIHQRGHGYIVIAGADERGILYGTFALLSRIAQLQGISSLDDRETPSAPIRWVDQWDNPSGTIERGY